MNRSRDALVILIVLWVLPVSATEERAVQVSQPIVTKTGLYVSDVTFVAYVGSESWGDLVWYTCQPSFVANEEGEPLNRNAANLAGITSRPDSFHLQNQSLYGDTMRVFVDLTEMDVSKIPCCPGDLVAATRECVLVNATRSMRAWDRESERQVTAKHLRVEVRGSSDPSVQSETYDLAELARTVPRERRFE